MKRHFQAAFTLIELSIVLVIIGLLIGAVISGRTLLRQSEINSVMVDAQRYINAVQAFKQKYNALPGDFARATSYWGAQSGCGTSNYGNASQGALTCNGDGNGQIASGAEDVYAWQHLLDAQLISGNYSGIPGAAGLYDNVPGANVPAGRISGSGFGIYWMGIITSSSTLYYPGNYGHGMFFGLYQSNSVPAGAVLTGVEAEAFDTKYDDGAPNTGSITAWLPTYYNASCVNASVGYNITSSGPVCAFILTTGF